MNYRFSAELWQYDVDAPLGFVTLPAELSEDIRAKHGPSAKSVGSIKVMVTIGATRWATSLFPCARTAGMCSRSRTPSERQSDSRPVPLWR